MDDLYLDNLYEERSRIARELHDGIAQDLAVIGYALDSEIGRSDTNPQSRQALREIRVQITELNSTVRGEIFKLRSHNQPVPQRQLESALAALQIEFTIHGSLPDSDIGGALFKVLLELARNAREHAGAEGVTIEITPSQIVLASDGASSDTDRGKGYGLIGVAERLADIGWELRDPMNFSHLEINQVP